MRRFDVTLAGDITLDLVLYGLPEELPVERELLAAGMAMELGGSAAITAHNLARLGSRVGFIPQLADDPFTELCVNGLKAAGVDLSASVNPKPGIATGLTVLLQHEQVRRSLTCSGTISALRYEDLDLQYLAQARHFHLSSFYLQSGLQPDVPRLLAALRHEGVTTSMDTNDDPSGDWQGPIGESLQHLDILMPNEREACSLSGEADLEAAIEKLSAKVPLLVVKCGASGAIAVQNGRRYSAPGLAVHVVDMVGAGDTFNAGFLHAYVNGASVEKCLQMGNLCGAYSTTASGGTRAFCELERRGQFFKKHGSAYFDAAKPVTPVAQ